MPKQKNLQQILFPHILAVVVYRSAGFSLRIIYCLCRYSLTLAKVDSLDPLHILAIALDFTQATSFIF
jgi:hypothetical protein